MPFDPPPSVLALQLPGLAIKASHNSYLNDHGWTVEDMLATPATPPYKARCRGVELDIVQDGHAAAWCVWHDYPYQDDASIQLSSYLKDLASWSTDQGGDHDPVFIHFDCKAGGTEDADFPAKFDEYILAALAGVPLYTPGQLLGTFPTLLEAAQAGRWARLEDLKGQFIPVLTGDSIVRRAAYLTGSPANRTCFVDYEVNLQTPGSWNQVALPNQLLVNFNAWPSLAGLDSWLAQFKDRDAMLLRAYDISEERWWTFARMVGINLLATDYVGFSEWATVGTYPFAAVGP